MAKKLKKWINGEALFLDYKYKKQTTGCKGKPKPYFPLKDISTHKYAVEYKEWKLIIQTYFSILVELLIEGYFITLPKKLGTLEICRVKTKSKVSTKQGVQRFRNLHTFGFKPRVVWSRYREGDTQFRMFYSFNVMKTQWKKISKHLMEHPEDIFKYPKIKK